MTQENFITLAKYYLDKNKEWRLSYQDLDRLFMIALSSQIF
jgi:hypothetical protein